MSLLAPLESIGDTIHRRVCPLYSFDERERVRMYGSAVPFRAGGTTFLITAAHVCLDAYQQAVPLFTWGSDGPLALLAPRICWDYQRGRNPDLDIALIALTDDCATSIAGCYQVSEPSDTAQTKPAQPRVHYMITGYPHVRNRVRPPEFALPAMATWLTTGDIRAVSEFGLRDKTDTDHFAIHLKLGNVPTLTGKTYGARKPQGMSGGGVWRLDIDSRSLLATTPLLVGIAIEYQVRSEVFVATRIQRAAPLAHDLVSLLSGTQPGDVVAVGTS